MFYLTTHSTHFIYGYMASDIWYSYRLRVNCYNCCDIKTGIFVDLQGPTERKEGNVLFNDALNTFYLWLYGIGHMVQL